VFFFIYYHRDIPNGIVLQRNILSSDGVIIKHFHRGSFDKFLYKIVSTNRKPIILGLSFSLVEKLGCKPIVNINNSYIELEYHIHRDPLYLTNLHPPIHSKKYTLPIHGDSPYSDVTKLELFFDFVSPMELELGLKLDHSYVMSGEYNWKRNVKSVSVFKYNFDIEDIPNFGRLSNIFLHINIQSYSDMDTIDDYKYSLYIIINKIKIVTPLWLIREDKFNNILFK
jgi:hypothetical protein